jgi:uncharacterized protein (DUF1330 family)
VLALHEICRVFRFRAAPSLRLFSRLLLVLLTRDQVYQPVEEPFMTSKFKIVLAAVVGAAVGAAAIHGLHAQARPKAYTVTELETLDAKAAADFAAKVAKMQESAGGRNLRTGGGKVTSMEGPPPQRVAITEWDNIDKAQAFFKSKDWADLGPERDKALKTVRRYAVEQRD